MSVSYLTVNTDKREFIDAHGFGESARHSGLFAGMHGLALNWLVCRFDSRKNQSVFGRWFGDKIVVAGESDEPDLYGIVATDENESEQNLFDKTFHEYRDITPQAAAMLFELNQETAEYLANKCKSSSSLLISAGDAVFIYGLTAPESVLGKIVGRDWEKKYREAWNNLPETVKRKNLRFGS